MDLPPLLRQIFEHALAGQSDLQTMSDLRAADADPRVTGTLPDIVITSGGRVDASRRSTALLDRWPSAKILVLTEMGRDAAMFELRPHRTELGQLSPAEAVDVIRNAVHRHG
jgi:hypothetical protein